MIMKKVLLSGGPLGGAYTEVESDIHGLVIELKDDLGEIKETIYQVFFGDLRTFVYRDTGRRRMCPVIDPQTEREIRQESRAVFEIDFKMSRGPTQWEFIL